MSVSLRNYLYQKLSAVNAARYRRMGMTIGENCKISRHAKLDRTFPQGIFIGDNTAISFDAAILTHDFVNGRHVETHIGANCFIGARSVVMPGVRIGDHSIIGVGTIVYADVLANSVVSGNPGRVVEKDIVTGKWGIRDPRFLEQHGITDPRAVVSARTAKPGAVPEVSSADALHSYFPDIDLDRPFADSALDSFALILLRAEIEENEGQQIADETWTAIERPRDLARFVTVPKVSRAHEVTAATAERSHEINMPQMIMGGLSESWLYKEIGDIHWSIIMKSLGVKSRDIADQQGNRLYATFTRIEYSSSIPLSGFLENDRLDFRAAMTRYGAGMFFSSIDVGSSGAQIRFQIMSSFSMFGQRGNNTSLVRGQPTIPSGFAIPPVAELPPFVERYREVRAEADKPAIFTTHYELVPNHDVNGVGLLYFAAYPVITDICMRRYWGADDHWSPVGRDLMYFANSGANATIEFRLVEFEVDGDRASGLSVLVRSDGVRMASVRSKYMRASRSSC